MSVRIPKRKHGYTMIWHTLMPEDGSLSARAWGLYCYLTSRPDGWECRSGHLASVFKEGRDATRAALHELVDAGLMTLEPVMEGNLRRTRFVLIDPDDLLHSTTPDSPGTDSQALDTQTPENASQVIKEVPTTDSTTPPPPGPTPANAVIQESPTEASSVEGSNEEGKLTPHAGHLVSAWIDAYRERNGRNPHTREIQRVSGAAKTLARSCHTRDEWNIAWLAAREAGKHNSLSLDHFLSPAVSRYQSTGGRSINYFAHHLIEDAARARAQAPGRQTLNLGDQLLAIVASKEA